MVLTTLSAIHGFPQYLDPDPPTASNVDPAFPEELVSLLGVESTGNAVNEMSKEEYQRLMQKYTNEYFEPVQRTKPAEKSFAFFKQVRELSQNQKLTQ